MVMVMHTPDYLEMAILQHMEEHDWTVKDTVTGKAVPLSKFAHSMSMMVRKKFRIDLYRPSTWGEEET